ncbi:hypothetical protein F5Y08DRAFT_252686 [Xylaria arbuscula]|nr:hypothetical protein F5Y08DRAFT_252686 [Xylaria arbuscula]
MDEFEIKLRDSDVVQTVVFGEATPEQLLRSRQLAGAEFGKPLTIEDYVETEKYLAQKPLVSDGGWQIWCLSLAQKPHEVLAACKTIHREVLVRDMSGIHRQSAYCIATVVTDPRYRGQGLQSRLLQYVSSWLDGPGNAVASMLYTSIGDFYDRRGWKMLPAYQATLSWHADSVLPTSRPNLPSTRPVLRAEVPALCIRDVRDVESHFAALPPRPLESHICVLPTANIITWLHDRVDFMSTKITGAPPQNRGSICESADSWLFWCHDFRKQQLAIQRVRAPLEATDNNLNALAAMLLDAVEEARIWKLSKVILWDPTDDLVSAMQILERDFGIVCHNGERINSSIPSLRWKHADETSKTVFHFREFYTWS